MSRSTQTNERRVTDARIEIHRDLEDLGRALRREEARLARHGLVVAGAAAALGFLIGMGGLKVTKRVLTFGAIAGAALAIARSRGLHHRARDSRRLLPAAAGRRWPKAG